MTINLTARQAEYLLNALKGMSKKSANKVYLNPTESRAIYEQLRSVISNEGVQS